MLRLTVDFFELSSTQTTKFLFEDARCIADEGDLVIYHNTEFMRYAVLSILQCSPQMSFGRDCEIFIHHAPLRKRGVSHSINE